MSKDDGFFHIGDGAGARQAGIAPPSYTAFAVHAMGTALRDHPDLNCMICEIPSLEGLTPLDDITATVAVEREVDGMDMVLALPIRDVDRKSWRHSR